MPQWYDDRNKGDQTQPKHYTVLVEIKEVTGSGDTRKIDEVLRVVTRGETVAQAANKAISHLRTESPNVGGHNATPARPFEMPSGQLIQPKD